MPLQWATTKFSVTQSGVEVVQDPELSKDDRPLWVAVEALDLAVFDYEHVAARGVHLLTRGRKLAKGKLQRAIVGALQGQLHHDDIAIDIDVIQLAVHVGKRRAVVADRIGEGATTVGSTYRIVDEHPVGREQVDPALQIFPFGNRIGVTNSGHIVI